MTELEALSIASFIASCGVRSEASPYANAPTNASPAPVVSTASTLGAGILITESLSIAVSYTHLTLPTILLV